MNEYAKKSILEMARGGFLEVTDLEMTKAIANIMDPNTSATAKRKITVKSSSTLMSFFLPTGTNGTFPELMSCRI